MSAGTITIHSNKYRPLSRRLEEEPLDERIPLLLVGDGQPLLRVVFVSEIEKDGIGLPHGEVAVLVVDQSGDTAVRVQLGMLGGLLLILAKIEIDGLVGKPKFLEEERDFPVSGARKDQGKYTDG